MIGFAVWQRQWYPKVFVLPVVIIKAWSFIITALAIDSTLLTVLKLSHLSDQLVLERWIRSWFCSMGRSWQDWQNDQPSCMETHRINPKGSRTAQFFLDPLGIGRLQLGSVKICSSNRDGKFPFSPTCQPNNQTYLDQETTRSKYSKCYAQL